MQQSTILLHRQLSDLQLVATPSNPAAGADFSYTTASTSVDPGLVLESLNIMLTTDANVANRLLRFRIKRGSTVLAAFAHTAVQAAGVGQTYYFVKNGTTSTASSTSVIVALPILPILLPGDVIESFILNKQAGDALTSPVLWFSKVHTY